MKKRRYYIHKKLKGLIKINPRQRQVSITDEIISSLDDKARSYLFELRDKFGYNLQYILS